MEQTFVVRDAPPDVFDAFISEVVETIINVDRKKWPIFQKWRIINAAISEDVLELLPDGDNFRLQLPEVGISEEKASTTEAEVQNE